MARSTFPSSTVTGAWGTQLGVSKAHENYVQHHFAWKDDVSYVRGPHDIKVGYEGFHGDNLTYFGQWDSQPNFSFLTSRLCAGPGLHGDRRLL